MAVISAAQHGHSDWLGIDRSEACPELNQCRILPGTVAELPGGMVVTVASLRLADWSTVKHIPVSYTHLTLPTKA